MTVTTTAGTGSETTGTAVFDLKHMKAKTGNVIDFNYSYSIDTVYQRLKFHFSYKSYWYLHWLIKLFITFLKYWYIHQKSYKMIMFNITNWMQSGYLLRMSLIFWQSYKIHLGEKLSLRPLVKFSFHCRELAAFTVENQSLYFSDVYKMQIFDLLHKYMYFFCLLHCRYLKPGDSSHTGYCWSPSS